MGVVLCNNVYSILAAPLAATATSLAVTPGDGALFPPLLGLGEYTYATLSSPGPPLAGQSVPVEVVMVTARAGDIMTIIRGQDNTVAQSFPTGGVVALRINAASVMDSFITNYDVLLL